MGQYSREQLAGSTVGSSDGLTSVQSPRYHPHAHSKTLRLKSREKTQHWTHYYHPGSDPSQFPSPSYPTHTSRTLCTPQITADCPWPA